MFYRNHTHNIKTWFKKNCKAALVYSTIYYDNVSHGETNVLSSIICYKCKFLPFKNCIEGNIFSYFNEYINKFNKSSSIKKTVYNERSLFLIINFPTQRFNEYNLYFS